MNRFFQLSLEHAGLQGQEGKDCLSTKSSQVQGVWKILPDSFICNCFLSSLSVVSNRGEKNLAHSEDTVYECTVQCVHSNSTVGSFIILADRVKILTFESGNIFWTPCSYNLGVPKSCQTSFIYLTWPDIGQGIWDNLSFSQRKTYVSNAF